jgi:hypothetical protein
MISPDLKLLALSALESRRTRLDREARIATLLNACRKCSNHELWVPMAEVMAMLGWTRLETIKTAREAVAAGWFPYRFAVASLPLPDAHVADIEAIHARAVMVREEFLADVKANKWTGKGDRYKSRNDPLDTISLFLRRFDGKPREEARAMIRLARRRGWISQQKSRPVVAA